MCWGRRVEETRVLLREKAKAVDARFYIVRYGYVSDLAFLACDLSTVMAYPGERTGFLRRQRSIVVGSTHDAPL
jgi:hypothetical protein